jgi:hypothetical protein
MRLRFQNQTEATKASVPSLCGERPRGATLQYSRHVTALACIGSRMAIFCPRRIGVTQGQLRPPFSP